MSERTCATCTHQWQHKSRAGIVHLFCRCPRVLEESGRKHIACVCAHPDYCGGRMWRGRAS